MSLHSILGEEMFKFENMKCEVKINRPKRYKEKRCFIVSCSDKKYLELTYDMKNGLTLLSDQTDDAKDAVIELYATGKIYSEYKQLKEKKKAGKEKLIEAENKLQKYIESFGFFFTLPENEKVEYESERLLRLVERLFVLMELKQETSLGMEINYNRVFELTFFFVFSVPPEIQYRDGDEIRNLNKVFYSIGNIWIQGSQWLRHGEVTLSEMAPEKHIQPEELEKVFFGSSDLLRGYKYWKDADEIFRKLEESKEGYHQESSNCNNVDQDMIDFLYGFAKDVAPINKIYPDGTIKQKLGTQLGESDVFMKKYKDRLMRIAKYVCAYEISKGVKEINLVCDSNTWDMKWKVSNLHSAIYLSLFSFGKKGETYRICLHCRKVFKTKEGKRSRKYCSDSCMKNGVK